MEGAPVSISELRRCAGKVVDRAASGERLTLTRSGRPVAEIHPITRPPLPVASLLERWRLLPPLDPDRFRADIDGLTVNPFGHPDG